MNVGFDEYVDDIESVGYRELVTSWL